MYIYLSELLKWCINLRTNSLENRGKKDVWRIEKHVQQMWLLYFIIYLLFYFILSLVLQ